MSEEQWTFYLMFEMTVAAATKNEHKAKQHNKKHNTAQHNTNQKTVKQQHSAFSV